MASLKQLDLTGSSTIKEKIYPLNTEDDLVNLVRLDDHRFILAYAPDTVFTRKIIWEFNKTLTDKILDLDSFHAFSSEKQLLQYFQYVHLNQSRRTSVYGIVFTGLDIYGATPAHFEYKIRSTDSLIQDFRFNNKDIFPSYIPQGPSQDLVNMKILAIQMALDKAYITLVTRGKMQYSMAVQQFPFPEFEYNVFNDIISIFLLPLMTIISFVTISTSILKRVVEEKASGIQELMKMMGLQSWMIWAGWVMNGLMIYIFICIAITFCLCYNFYPESGPLLGNVHFTVVFVFYLLFCTASIFFCFALSTIFVKPMMAMSVGMILWCGSGFYLTTSPTTERMSLYLLKCLFPTFGIKSSFHIIQAFGIREDPLSWSNLFTDVSGNGSSLGLVMFMFLVQMVFYMTITWYVSSIHPGPYGRAEPWYFIFKKVLNSIKRCTRKSSYVDLNLFTSERISNEEYFESPPSNLVVGLQIRDLRKVFNGNMVAVDKVNLDIYEGQITALLGHNGAGKTTTMSIITGMYSPTSGSVFAENYNIFEDMDRFRLSLGLCPQHDMFFPFFTAIEHLIFFGMLKGLSKQEAIDGGEKILRRLKIDDKMDVLASKLSGGMKRKLSLAIALIGDPKVLILDEPTSGMDTESRREVWDILLGLRQGRTVVITTHFMEEADALGDRIAIMNHGNVKCYGTSMYLKKIFGTGYQLTLMKAAHSPVEPITTTIQSKVEGAELKSEHPTQVVYNLPQERAASLPAMFAEIEGHKAKLGVTNMGISCTTMEEVFLKVGSLTAGELEDASKTNQSAQVVIGMSSDHERGNKPKVTGFPLLLQQAQSLLLKRFRYTIRKPWTYLLLLVLIIVLTKMVVSNSLLDLEPENSSPLLTLRLSQYGKTNAYQTSDPLLNTIYSELVRDQEGTPTVIPIKNITKYLIRVGEENLPAYRTRTIVAADFTTLKNTAIAMYNGIAYFSAPISLNLISNTLLRANPATAKYTITMSLQPLDIEVVQYNDLTPWGLAVYWMFFISLALHQFLRTVITFPHLERTSNAKQLQLMTGLPPLLYWATSFTWDYLSYLVCCLVMFIDIFISDYDGFMVLQDYSVLLLILVLYGVSGISCSYLYSFLAKSKNTAAYVFMFASFITGCICPPIIHGLDALEVKKPWFKVIKYVLHLDPHFLFGSSILDFAVKVNCNYIRKTYPSGLFYIGCKGIDKPYLELRGEDNPNGILQFVLLLAVDWLLYMGIIMLIEYGYMGQLVHKANVRWVGQVFERPITEDSDVRDERDQIGDTRDDHNEVVLTVNNLVKKFSPKFTAVQGVSFRVSAGECFGLLGVNGAGKTTTFRMLTGDENPTSGSAKILHYDLVNNRREYLAQIGYCPQFDGTCGFLTGEEMVRHFAKLRGIPKHIIDDEVGTLINKLGLDEFRKRRCGNYSGGNKRKLSTALALIGELPVVFLDEPTSGVDPAARRRMWDVLAQCQRQGQAIVLTSHSMEECEALCGRLTIMVGGQMKCIGQPDYLKARFGQGYTVIIKLDSTRMSEVAVNGLKTRMVQVFPDKCELIDGHESLLHYHIKDPVMSLSILFGTMEKLKQSCIVIEDYTVGNTTLEQLFIKFARDA